MTDRPAAVPTDSGEPSYPGEEGVWMFVLGDLFIFSMFFLTFLYYRDLEPSVFRTAGSELTHSLGVVNTLVLLTSSWCAAAGVSSMRRSHLPSARTLFGVAFLFGALFVGIKSAEFYAKISMGFGLATNNFFMFFFMFGGIHLVHVLVGLIVLMLIIRTLASEQLTPRAMTGVESGAIYWHLVDVLWIILFSLFYLLA